MDRKKYDFEDRLVRFAGEVILFTKDFLDDYTARYFGGQLIRSASSAALNYGEAQGTETKKDFIHKAALVLKELKETRVSLKILLYVKYGNDAKRTALLEELEELIAICATMIKNKRKK